MIELHIALIGWAVGIMCGVYIGQRVESWKWTRNADEDQRIELYGRLYKVRRADPGTNWRAGEP